MADVDATAAILAEADLTSSSSFFNGDDTIILRTSSGEDVDSVFLTAGGDLLLCTSGSAGVSGVSGIRNEDVLHFSPTSLGTTTSGSCSLEIDGSDVGLDTANSEDFWGVWVDEASGDFFLTSRGAFTVSKTTGDGADIFVCGSPTTVSSTACTFSLFLDGSFSGFGGEAMDGLHIERP